MSGRFTLAGLLMGVTFLALVLAMAVPAVRYARRVETHADSVASLAASADGSTFAALMGDGRVLFWDQKGSPKGSLQTQATFGATLVLSFDGELAAVSPGHVWETSTRAVWRTLPTSVSAVIFSPTEERIAVLSKSSPAAVREDRFAHAQQGGRRPALVSQVYTMDRYSRPRMIADGQAAAFSPDGKRIAVAAAGRLDIYDLAKGALQQSLAKPTCHSLAWAPNGQSLAGVFSPRILWDDPQNVFVLTVDLPGGTARSTLVLDEEPMGGECHTLAFSPDGRIFVGAPMRGFKAFDADTLEHLAAADMPKVCHVAAGLMGDAFIAAESHAVDLWDVPTLRPRQRLFEAFPKPDHRPPICGLTMWVVIFALRRRAKKAQAMLEVRRSYS